MQHILRHSRKPLRSVRVKAEEFQRSVGSLPYGKILPGARYIVRPEQDDVPDQLYAEIRRAEIAAQPAPDWNLLKLHLAKVIEERCGPFFVHVSLWRGRQAEVRKTMRDGTCSERPSTFAA